MISESLRKEIKAICTVLTDEPMSLHTSFKVGGNAQAVVFPGTEGELSRVLDACKGEKHVIIGNGSNVVFADGGYDGVVIITDKIDDCRAEQIDEDVFVTAGAGLSLPTLTAFAKKNALAGLEFACGIPGSVGGAVFMNAGAYGGEMKDVLHAVKCVGDETYQLIDKDAFTYRFSPYMREGKIITSAVFKLKKGNADEISAHMKDYLTRRRDKQPLEYPSAGSVFKRPEGYFAGKLIEDASLKGVSVGGAQVSEKHAGFIINTGGATADDIKALVRLIQNTVREKFGVELECEIRFID